MNNVILKSKVGEIYMPLVSTKTSVSAVVSLGHENYEGLYQLLKESKETIEVKFDNDDRVFLLHAYFISDNGDINLSFIEGDN